VKFFSLSTLLSPRHSRGLGVPSPSDLLERSETVDRVKTALAKLPHRHREALLAWAREHPQGFSCHRLAHLCGVTGAAVCKWADKARRQLAHELGDLQ